MDNKTYPFTPMTISYAKLVIRIAYKKYCSQTLNHLGNVKLHGFHDDRYTILKHGQYFFYNFSLISNVFIIIDEYAI